MDESLLRATEARLWDLVSRRMRDGADAAEIDRQIRELFEERWAVVFTDLAGFSRKAEAYGITHFLQVIFRQRELLFPIIRDFGGILVKSEADSLLLIFRTAAAAIDCSIEMQRATKRANARLVEADEVHLCVGVGVGEVLRIGDHDICGHQVNAASTLGEDTANAGQILVTDSVIKDLGQASPYESRDIEDVVAGSSGNAEILY